MAYKMSKGKRSFGDIEFEDDAQRNTLIDFDEDQIDLQTGGAVRLQVNNNGVYIPDSPTNASLFVSGGIQLTPGNQEGIRFTNKGNTALNFISFQEGASASSQDARLGYNSEEYIFISPGRSGDFFINSAKSSGDFTYPFSIMDDGTAKFTKGLTSVTDRALDLDSSIAFYVSGTTDGNNDAVFDGNVILNGTTLQGSAQRVMIREVSSFPYTVADDDYIIAVAGTGSPRRIDLPAKANHLGRILIIKDASSNASSNNIEINPYGPEDIDDAGDKLVNTNKASLTIVCGSDQWYILGNYPG
tara:strand:- start:719 stop:1621 length:903 start_codon:yes stop_codon:yes gene_type:complete